MSGTFAVVTGGGTAGHVLPALAVAEALVEAGHSVAEVHYVGTTRGVETRLVPPTGHPHTFLDVVGLQRSMSRRNLAFLPKLVRATSAAVRLLRDLQPRVVVNLGGYGSFPATYAARRLGIPYVVVSYDRRPGLVSRVMARRAAACAVAFEGSALPRAVHTGAPVRRSIVAVDRAAQRDGACAVLGLPPERTIVAVMCGSLGASVVNRAVVEAVDILSGRGDLAVYHAVGERNLVEPAPERDGTSGILYRVIGYEEKMEAVYAAADLMVTRAGAGTIAELATVGMPAIVVPWPGAAENHQVDNAKVLSDVGGAVLLEQHQLDGRRLAEEISRLADDADERTSIAAAAWSAGAMHRSSRLVALLDRVAR